MTKDLTEQWKNGELEEGVYYCNTGYVVETLFTWGKNYHQLTNNKDEVYIPEMDDCEVLAPVPSYEEWQKYVEANESMFSVVKMLNKDNYQLEKDIDKLKELLKECREVAEFTKTIVNKHKWFNEVITKIDEVLK